MLPSSSSSKSTARDEPRFHLKLLNGLFDRSVERRPIFNEPPLPGVLGDVADANGVPRRELNPTSSIFYFIFRIMIFNMFLHMQIYFSFPKKTYLMWLINE